MFPRVNGRRLLVKQFDPIIRASAIPFDGLQSFRSNVRTCAIFLVTWCLLFGVDGRRRDQIHPAHADDTEEISCERRDRCANSSSALPFHARNCFCDDSCRAYGDCCQDHPSIQAPPPPPPPPPPSLMGTTSCRRNEDIDRNHEIHIVDHCPRSFQEAAVRRNCENERTPETFKRLPVTGRTSGVLYRNVYCAVCSGDREFVFWELAYRCNRLSDAAVVTIDNAEEFRRLTQNCTQQLLPPPGLTPRKCKSSIDECDKKWKDNRVAKKCKGYTSYVYLDLETYRNRHCAICNYVRNSSLTCYDQRSPNNNRERTWDDSSRQTQSTTRYVIYDANTRRAFVRSGTSAEEEERNRGRGGTRELGNCSGDSVYDIVGDVCRCTVEKCSENTSTTKKTTTTTTTTASVSVTGGVKRPLSGAVTTTTTKMMRGRRTTVATKRYARTTVATTKATKMNVPSKHTVPTARLLLTLRSTGLGSSTRESTSTRASTTMSTTSISTVGTSANTVTSTSAGTNTVKYKANVSGSFNRIPSAVVTFTDKVKTASSATSILLRTTAADFSSFAEKTSKKTTALEVEVKRSSSLSTALPLVSSRIIENGILENSEPSTRLGARGVVTPATTNGVEIVPDLRGDFDDHPSEEEAKNRESGLDARWQNCSDTRSMFVYDRLQSLASFVATLVSMVCLLITFVAILLLPLMQTMRGRILLSLSLCLFVGQLLYLVALPSYQPVHHHPGAWCYWLGCALHYFVLVGFFWISVLAFDTSWSVIGDRLDAAVQGGGCRYVAYSVYAWLTPAAVVIAGVVTDFLGADRFLIRPCYGQGVCFVAGTFSLLLILAVPAGVLVLVSVFVYFLAASNACFEASRSKSKNGTRGGRLLAVCLSLTVLAALTWVAAFVAAFQGPRAVWWAFVAVSPSQGIFMFAAFVCRRSVLGQLRKGRRRGKGKEHPKPPNGSSSSPTQWSYRRDFSPSAAMTDQRDLGISNPEFLQNETYM